MARLGRIYYTKVSVGTLDLFYKETLKRHRDDVSFHEKVITEETYYKNLDKNRKLKNIRNSNVIFEEVDYFSMNEHDQRDIRRLFNINEDEITNYEEVI